MVGQPTPTSEVVSAPWTQTGTPAAKPTIRRIGLSSLLSSLVPANNHAKGDGEAAPTSASPPPARLYLVGGAGLAVVVCGGVELDGGFAGAELEGEAEVVGSGIAAANGTAVLSWQYAR